MDQIISDDVALYSNSNSKTLVVSFTAVASIFQFRNSLGSFVVNKLFLKDSQEVYYHKGVCGIASSIGELVEYINTAIKKLNINHTVMIGSSCGGYAAMLFGCFCQAQQVISFSPQTLIGDVNMIQPIPDWKRLHYNVLQLQDNSYFDLAKVLENSHNTNYYIYYDSTFPLDVIHAERMKDTDKVELCPIQGDNSHQLVTHLKRRGQILPILQPIINKEM